MNTTEYKQAHAEQARRVSESWHRRALEPTLASQQRKHSELERARSDALQRSIDSYRNPGEAPR